MGLGLAFVALLADIKWPVSKLSRELAILYSPLGGGKSVIGEDIHANVLAGGLVSVWPVIAALAVARFDIPRRAAAVARLFLLGSLFAMTAILLLTQSRGAFLALCVAVVLMVAVQWPRSQRSILVASVALGLALWQGGIGPLADVLSNTGTISSWIARQEVWSRAIYMIHDFPFTEIGLSTFDQVQPLLYPFFLLHGVRVHHAHNLFLQLAVDLGLPGLIAYMAIQLGVAYATWQAWQRLRRAGSGWMQALALGLLGSQAALVAHGLLDAAVWGNRVSLLPWLVFGLALALERIASEAP